MATTGNAQDFGDATGGAYAGGASSSSTRGIIALGSVDGSYMNTIDFITISTTGNAQDFGDSFLGGFGCGGASPTRGVAGGGYFANAPTGETGGFTNIIDFIEIATTGNSKDFGDLTNTVRHIKGESNGHGGL